MKVAARSGTAFIVLFVAGFVLGLGTLVGSFADPDRVFTERWADGGNRIKDIIGSYFLALAGMAFVWFAEAISRDMQTHRAPVLIAGSMSGGAMMLAAVAWATVPMSITFGSWVDDPGIEAGQAVLPQFGYVALGMGAMLPAAAFIVLVARAPGLLPRWLAGVSYPVAIVVAGTALLFMPMFLFLAWVLAVVVMQWSHAAGVDAPGP